MERWVSARQRRVAATTARGLGRDMNRRQFLAASLGALPYACSAPLKQPVAAGRPIALPAGSRLVELSSVQRLVVERTDPVTGRCHYVADLGGERVAQPILIARRGEIFDAAIDNRLPQPTTVHFHGLTMPEAQDGAGFESIAAGGRKDVRFQVQNRSALYWLHAHPHGFTAEQVYSGLYALLVVTDEDDDALDAALELIPGNRLALAVADVRVGGAIRPYAPTLEDCLHGWFGNRALVNGTLEPRWMVAPGWVRLQILNTCNARGLCLAFRDGDAAIPFHLVGTDGGLLSVPRKLERVFIYSAERVDVCVNLAGRRSITAVSIPFDPRHQVRGTIVHRKHGARERYPPLAPVSVCEGGPEGGSSYALPDGSELPLFALDVKGTAAKAAPSMPSRVSQLAESSMEGVAATRRIRLDFDERAGFLIDDTPYRVDELAFSTGRGASEIWEIKNSPISMPHPMHVHGFGFRVLRRQGTYGDARALAVEGGSRLPTDLGVKDTVVVWPNETVWLAVDFTLPDHGDFCGRQRYMFHCHNLEHEDAMMMRNFAVL